MDKQQTNQVMKTKQAAAYLGVSSTTLRRLCQERKIAFLSSGDNTSPLRFLLSDLDSYLATCRVPTKGAV